MRRKEPASPTPARRYFKEVRFRQIRALVEIGRRHSFAAAAASVGIAVPSIWQQVRALEDEYGVQLVVAKGPQVSLTDDGRLLVDLAAPMVESFDSLRQLFEDRHRAVPRTLTVVAPTTLFHNALRGLVIDYRKQFPAVKLSLIDRPSFAARQVIENDGADLAILGIASGDDPLPRFEKWLLIRSPFRLFCPEDHLLATAPRLRLADFVRYPLILGGDDSCNFRHVRHIFAKAGLAGRMNVNMTATNNELQLSYTAIGFGITINSNPSTSLPKPRPGEKKLVVRDVSALFGHEEIFLLQPKGRYELPHLKAFRELVVARMKAP